VYNNAQEGARHIGSDLFIEAIESHHLAETRQGSYMSSEFRSGKPPIQNKQILKINSKTFWKQFKERVAYSYLVCGGCLLRHDTVWLY
jgi:hypothetical protein